MDLTESNPTRVGLPYPTGEILAALANPESLVYEPSPRGLPAARKAVSGVFADRDLRVDPEDVFLTASTSEAYAWLFKLLAEPGDDVLVPRPSYPLFEYLTRLESLRLVSYPLVDDGGWSVDLAALEGEVGLEPEPSWW
ncbi:MAG TPA: aminotransferase class I/II-fold pyridoxal phosphate-dependent enzyme, partial [Candidatus Polarisedimenticolia bacterium]|nr:aminotransferase class I/II-fold pyridoxal phosphate-dependent enzyme [Candidatus Polarisedimenticolia bacterium]